MKWRAQSSPPLQHQPPARNQSPVPRPAVECCEKPLIAVPALTLLLLTSEFSLSPGRLRVLNWENICLLRCLCLGNLLQKLKRSLSFKTKSLRSKSADNFFQRTNSDVKLQVDLMPEVSTSTGQLPSSESQASSPTRAQQLPENKAHIFQEHIFKKPTFCDVCNHMIVGTNAKHGLRCKACKMSIHHKCADSTGQQRCMGKLPKGFRRYYSSPLLIHEQFGCIKEVMPIACGNKVDPVYETLRFGTSLAQKTKKGSSGSGSDSPNRNSTADLAEVPEEADSSLDISRKRSNSVFTYSENGTEHFGEEPKNIHSPTSSGEEEMRESSPWEALCKQLSL
ncbi:SH3 and cysteine-rich domain-containing protein isoform X6 [Oxyura jamaicensis]|uniref:SH3 and cysteine-rich domain-containing protein isoform X6 n=1 Tax=Oxyura jamaicensis TaxID=8884 RepID=UPI0015A54B05|nr:SH3 and cysteine-rich domain-containing protein isoform X6 [Oxyura jamaicensis]